MKHLITAKDWMSKPVLSCKKETSVKEAAELMAHNNVGCLIVVDKDKPVGIVTERDLLIKLVAPGLNPEKLQIQDIMTPKVYTVDEDTPLLDVCRLMKRHKCRRILVVDKEGKPVGIITSRDLIDLVSV
ncbi:CBS domain-containing protein [Candidatus Woesearchaeota archaeon]|nr:CBS domain-containing protein [Candidatus Woesearchaeota archaeon]